MIVPMLDQLKHSPIHNYGGIPGLTSWLVGEPSKNGLVRLMECSRDHFEPIIPHSHRFDFACLVLRGWVMNIIWERSDGGDHYQTTELVYDGAPGQYGRLALGTEKWTYLEQQYLEGQQYTMKAEEVHSIFFSRGAKVLFFEGPQHTTSSIILQPVVGGEVVPTFTVPEWAFKRG